jgi:lipopolysaccharide/colanic/teichoic acid biosynthesis glycosyltransferase
MTESNRAFDVIVAVVLGALTAPVWIAAAVAVRLSSPGPILHRASRVGRGGGTFTLLKFRSMVVGAAAAGPGVTGGGDPRITRVGRWLRRAKIDELPQLLNVLRGEMAIVGPRPEDPRYVEWYSEMERTLLEIRPGVTSPASVRFRDEESLLGGAPDVEAAYRDLLHRKLAIELAYFGQRNLRSDLGVLVSTAAAVLR